MPVEKIQNITSVKSKTNEYCLIIFKFLICVEYREVLLEFNTFEISLLSFRKELREFYKNISNAKKLLFGVNREIKRD